MLRILMSVTLGLWLACAQAVTSVYTDFTSWAAAAGAPVTLDFETPDASGGNVALNGNEYAGLPGTPELAFTPTPGANSDDSLQVGEGRLEVQPSSGDQLLFPGLFEQGVAGNGGILTFTADDSLSAVAAVFSDVEQGRSTTGFDLNGDGTIDVVFGDTYPASGDGERLFLGFVTDEPVAAVDVHINSANPPPGAGADGVGLDDLSFSTSPAQPEPQVDEDIPIPAAWLAFLAAALVFSGLRQRRTPRA